MNRTIPPSIERVENFNFLKAKKINLQNGLAVFYINGGSQTVVKIDFVFLAGFAYQIKPLQSAAVAQLLTEGTQKKTAEKLAEIIEQYGALIDVNAKADIMELSLYCLTDKLEILLPIVKEMIEESIFSEDELQNYLENQKQKLSINLQKVSFLAKNEFMAGVFGKEHPYNNKIELADFDKLNRNDLLEFYQGLIQNSAFEIFVSGKVGEKELSLIDKFFGKRSLNTTSEPTPKKINRSLENTPIYLEKNNAKQAAIRLGKRTIGKDHPDFPSFYFLNMLLGGYFGSRLMTNIREEKGYTYGIGSGLVSLKQGSYFFITSELGVNYLNDTLTEIKKEMKILQDERISDDELNLLKNYLQGSIMRSFDGAFAAMERFKSIHLLGLDYQYYENLIFAFKEMTADNLISAAKTYLSFDDLKLIAAGQMH